MSKYGSELLLTVVRYLNEGGMVNNTGQIIDGDELRGEMVQKNEIDEGLLRKGGGRLEKDIGFHVHMRQADDMKELVE